MEVLNPTSRYDGNDKAVDDSGHLTEDESLVNNIQSLCQELQDMILSFMCPVPATVHITKDFKPPIALQQNRKLRAKFAQDYYGTSVFKSEVRHLLFLSPARKSESLLLTDYFRSLSKTHKDMMESLQVIRTDRPVPKHFGVLIATSARESLALAGLSHANIVIGFNHNDGQTTWYDSAGEILPVAPGAPL